MSTENSKVRVGRVAGRQWGRVTRAQLHSLGITESTIAMWLRQGYLQRLPPRVYAVGHPARSPEADLAAALLYAGPGAMLSHATAGWWLGLLDHQPDTIHISTPRQCRSLKGIRVHARRGCERAWERRLPARHSDDHPKQNRQAVIADFRRMGG